MSSEEYIELVHCFVENGSVTEFDIPNTIRNGIRWYDEVWYKWGVYRREDLPPQLAAAIILSNPSYDGGPGREFASCPSISASKSYVLVTQRGGLDI